MRTILVTGAGGAPTTNFVRSLRLTGEKFHIIGVDCDAYTLQRAETDEKYLVPKCTDINYLQVINKISQNTGAIFIHAQPDMEIEILSEYRENLYPKVFLPSKETVKICMDKFKTFEKWNAHGIKVPQTMEINRPEDLKECFTRFGPKIWIREFKGGFGKGSLPTDRYEQAKAWIDFQNGWGKFLGAECLESKSVTWQSIWKNGVLMVAQGRERLYWEFANRCPSGVTGITGAGVTVSNPKLDEIAQKAIFAVDSEPNGIFSMDLTYDKNGIPNPTEINIGRFFTTHLFFSVAGLNMPYIYFKLAMGEQVYTPFPQINPLPPGLVWIRGMDTHPVLTDLSTIKRDIDELAKTTERL